MKAIISYSLKVNLKNFLRYLFEKNQKIEIVDTFKRVIIFYLKFLLEKIDKTLSLLKLELKKFQITFEYYSISNFNVIIQNSRLSSWDTDPQFSYYSKTPDYYDFIVLFYCTLLMQHPILLFTFTFFFLFTYFQINNLYIINIVYCLQNWQFLLNCWGIAVERFEAMFQCCIGNTNWIH